MLRRRARHRDTDPARLRRLAVTCACAAALAGCGDGEPAPTSGGEEPRPLTRAEFIAEADRVCFATESQIEAAADDLLVGDGQPPPREARRVARDVVAPRLRSQAETIRLIGPPREDRAEVERILEATERGAARIEEDPLRYSKRPPAALREAERLAKAYGSEQCGLRYRGAGPGFG